MIYISLTERKAEYCIHGQTKKILMRTATSSMRNEKQRNKKRSIAIIHIYKLQRVYWKRRWETSNARLVRRRI